MILNDSNEGSLQKNQMTAVYFLTKDPKGKKD